MGGKGKKNKGKAHGGQQKGGRKGQTHDERSEPAVVLKGKPGRLLPVHGLSNLGNTCFFNSVMQNLGQSQYFRARLERLLTSPSYNTEIHIPGRESSERTLSVVDGVGPLTSKLFSFLTQMQTPSGGCLNPRPVFSEICKKAPRFSGYHQQDSQELLRYLLDSLHSEEINRIKRAILQSYSVTGSKKEQQALLTESDRADIKAYGLQAFHAGTFVYDVFGGMLMSTVVCKECGNLSTMHETFLDLSLPVAEDKSIASPTSPGGYQTRNKSKKKGDSAETPWPGQQMGQSKLSKHQLKKREQQAKKAARRSNKRGLQTSLLENIASDELQEDGSSQNNPDVAGGENSHLDACLNDGDMEDTDKTIVQNSDNNSTSIATETGDRPKDDLMDSAAGEPQSLSTTSVEGGDDQGVTEIGMNGYAASGPLPDTGASLDGPVGGVAGLVGGVAGLVDGVAGLELKNQKDEPNESENCGIEMTKNSGSLTAKPEDEGILASSSQTAAVGADSENGSRDLKSLEVEFDSLQFSLKKFCTAELLTGSNKFACVVCTKLKAEEQQPSEQEGEDGVPNSLEQGQDEGPNPPEQGQDEGPNPPEQGQDEGPSPPEQGQDEGPNPPEQGQDEGPSPPEQGPDEGPNPPEQGQDEGPNSPEQGQDEGPNPQRGLDKDPDLPEISDTEVLYRITGECHSVEDDGQCGSQASVTQQENLDSSDSTENNQHDDREAVELKEEDSHTDEDGDNQDPKPKGKESDIVFCEATKQLLIEKPPPLFTLHLKRFIQNGRRLRKNNRHVSFPTVLDISPFCVDDCKSECDSKGRMLYSLYGIVEHSGSMHGGHYIAYVRVRPPLNTALSLGTKLPNKTNKESMDTNNQTIAATKGSGDPDKESEEVTKDSDKKQASPNSVKTNNPAQGNSSMTSNNVPCKASASVGACKSSGATDCTLNFDLSSTKGQWYYISDSHVRTATENEVLKSQAYLLFYERLPLV